MPIFHTIAVPEVFSQLNSSPDGLNDDQAAAKQHQSGLNVLQEAKQKTRLTILLEQFTDVMIIILIVAAGISFMVGERTDAYVILAIIIGNAWMGYYQEYNAEKSIRLLQKMSAQFAITLRNKKPVRLEAAQLVPGDLILLEAGDIVPADARLVEVNAFKTAEASLTGESHAIEKITAVVPDEHAVPGDQLNMVFKGTMVSNGSAKAVVTDIGMKTEIGKIAGMLAVGAQKTPLQKRLAIFSKQLAVIVLVICLVIFGVGIWRGESAFAMFLTALSLAVAALPEALPAVITIALAQGAKRMVTQKALMRKLPAVETLGSVTYICSDKTGTLTQNVMSVEKIEAAAGKEDLMQHAMLLNNEVRFGDEGLLGDATEKALVDHALEQGNTKAVSDKDFPLIGVLPFDSERMRMSTFHKYGDRWILFVKGAPSRMVEVMDESCKSEVPGWLAKNKAWAGDGLRVLFFAYKLFEKDPGKLDQSLEKDLDFLGMTAMIDPPREEVINAIAECKTAGIQSVMITGDQPLTAVAIATRLGMVEHGYTGVKTGADLQPMNPDAFAETVKHTTIYARVSPEQKLNIVKALQANGAFVAMTGDGVNDAPSLKQADIGVAMGITGTDVSKESADMILLDDNFATIVKAIREGRRIYDNIRKFILYVLSCNMGEILTIFIAPFLGFAIPLLPTHLLWINLVTDGLPGLALVAEPAEKDIMTRPPRPPKENLFAGGLALRIILSGLVLTISALGVQWWGRHEGYDVKTQQTMVFTTLCFVQLANALSVRSVYQHAFKAGFFSNKGLWVSIVLTVVLQMLIVYTPFLQKTFKTTALPWNAFDAILVATAGSFISIELLKYLFKRKYLHRG